MTIKQAIEKIERILLQANYMNIEKRGGMMAVLNILKEVADMSIEDAIKQLEKNSSELDGYEKVPWIAGYDTCIEDLIELYKSKEGEYDYEASD